VTHVQLCDDDDDEVQRDMFNMQAKTFAKLFCNIFANVVETLKTFLEVVTCKLKQ